jgi:hypothetical protein
VTVTLASSTPESSNQAYSNLVAIGSITLEIASEATQSPPAGLEVSTGMLLSARIGARASLTRISACPLRSAHVAPTRITREAFWLCTWDCYALKMSMR